MNNLIIDAANEKIFFMLIKDKNIYSVSHENSKTNYEKLTILINDFLEDGTYKQYSLTDRLEAFVTYLELTEKYNIRFANIKQQAIRFTKGTVGGGQLRNRLSAAKTTDDLKELLLQKVTV